MEHFDAVFKLDLTEETRMQLQEEEATPMETYRAKTRGMGLLYGENCTILTTTVFA